MARDPDTIQRDIEEARDALASTLDALTERAHPKRLVEGGKQTAQDKLADPRVKYTLIALGGLVVLVLARKIFR
ncbi:MAG: DUF3618 domain-containing protein [Pseudonocardia sp.]